MDKTGFAVKTSILFLAGKIIFVQNPCRRNAMVARVKEVQMNYEKLECIARAYRME